MDTQSGEGRELAAGSRELGIGSRRLAVDFLKLGAGIKENAFGIMEQGTGSRDDGSVARDFLACFWEMQESSIKLSFFSKRLGDCWTEQDAGDMLETLALLNHKYKLLNTTQSMISVTIQGKDSCIYSISNPPTREISSELYCASAHTIGNKFFEGI